MKLRTYDLGYGIALVVDPKTARVFRARLPFPLTWASWKYLIRRRFERKPL